MVKIPEDSQIEVAQTSKIEKVVLFPIGRYSTTPATYADLCVTVRHLSHGAIKVCLDDSTSGMIPIKWNPQTDSDISFDDAVQMLVDRIYESGCKAADEK